MKITFIKGPQRKKPQAGDEKTVKGVTYIRQQKFSKVYGAYVVSSGKPVFEWVEKGGELDRMANNRKREKVGCGDGDTYIVPDPPVHINFD